MKHKQPGPNDEEIAAKSTLVLPCPEPGCGGKLYLRTSRFGLFFGCENYGRKGCKGTHGSHPDGTPMGEPGDLATKHARMRVHAVFDRLWQEGRMKRKQAYTWLQRNMEMTPEQAHIGKFDQEQCDRVIEKVIAFLATQTGSESDVGEGSGSTGAERGGSGGGLAQPDDV